MPQALLAGQRSAAGRTPAGHIAVELGDNSPVAGRIPAGHIAVEREDNSSVAPARQAGQQTPDQRDVPIVKRRLLGVHRT